MTRRVVKSYLSIGESPMAIYQLKELSLRHTDIVKDSVNIAKGDRVCRIESLKGGSMNPLDIKRTVYPEWEEED